MRRFAPVLLVLLLALLAMPAHAVVVSQCGSRSVVAGSSCHIDFQAGNGGYFIKLHPGRAFSGTLTAQVTNPVAGFSVRGTFLLGRRVSGSDTFLHDLTAGTWKLTVTAAPLSIGQFSGSVEAGPF